MAYSVAGWSGFIRRNVCELKDNIGINISKYNPFFCETTGHFWIMNNAEKSDYVGVEHYRRHFDLGKEEGEFLYNILGKFYEDE